MAPLVFLVTGATSGLGAAVASEIVARGDKVIASGRKVEEKLGHLKSENYALLELDIMQDESIVEAKIKEAWDIYGHIDVLLNNAGATMVKTAEEAKDEEVTNLFNVNLFGPMRTTRAILPLLRAQGHGIIAFTSSSAAWMTNPFQSHYGASKAALSSWVGTLHRELDGSGIRCVSMEPGGFPTNLGHSREPGGELNASEPQIDAYKPLFMDFFQTFMGNMNQIMSGDVNKCAARMVDIVKGEGMAAGKSWNVRIAIGSDSLGFVRGKCERQLQVLEKWQDLSTSTDSDENSAQGHKILAKYMVD